MGFLFINTTELSALRGLPYIQQSAYMFGIRPYMDRKSFIVGVKRRISYDSLREELYVEPHQGLVSTGSPGREQVRRIIKSLERAGLVEIKSVGKQLILKCLLADTRVSVQNKPDTKPTHQPNTNQTQKKPSTAKGSANPVKNDDITQTAKPDTPHNSVNNYSFFLGEKLKTFW